MKSDRGLVKVSVVIPVYNVALYLEECLDSVLGQTLEEIEIICVNDGSTDTSGEILEGYARKDDRIRIITQENQGLSQARNRGMTEARGEYLYFLDSDDWIELETCEILYGTAKEKDLDVLYFAIQQEDEQHQQEDLGYYHRVESTAQEVWTGLDMFQFMMNTHTYHPQVVAQWYKTAFIQKKNLTFIPGILYEDCAFSLFVIFQAQRTYCIENILYHYRYRDHSIVRSQVTTRNIDSYMTIWMSYLLLIKSTHLSPEHEKIALDYAKHLRKLTYQEYRKVYPEHDNGFHMSCAHMEAVYFGASQYQTDDSHNMLKYRENYPSLCFFGAGEECHRMLDFFKVHDLTYPVGICDNAESKHGTEIQGVLVMSLEQAYAQYPDMAVIVTSLRVYDKLKTQAEALLGAERIILFEI